VTPWLQLKHLQVCDRCGKGFLGRAVRDEFQSSRPRMMPLVFCTPDCRDLYSEYGADVRELRAAVRR
jgi:hypothetical protein